MNCDALKQPSQHNVWFYCLHYQNSLKLMCVYFYLIVHFSAAVWFVFPKRSVWAPIPYVGDMMYCIYLRDHFFLAQCYQNKKKKILRFEGFAALVLIQGYSIM